MFSPDAILLHTRMSICFIKNWCPVSLSLKPNSSAHSSLPSETMEGCPLRFLEARGHLVCGQLPHTWVSNARDGLLQWALLIGERLIASFILFAIWTEDNADHSVRGRERKKKCRRGKMLRSINDQGGRFRRELDGGSEWRCPQISLILPLIVVQCKVTRIPVAAMPAASLAEEKERHREKGRIRQPAPWISRFLVFYGFPVCLCSL